MGNYFGAMKQFVELQNEYESCFMIADYHALIDVQNAEELSSNTLGIAIDYLAIGLNPEKVTIFKQSDVPEHTELTWIFNCITTVPYLSRAHAYKDALAQGKEANVGLFDYPMLMATDILMYDPDIVPVGQDQKQHVEMARDTAEKFNRIFGTIFKIPEAKILEAVATISGIDGRKMSKSYDNIIPLFAEDDELKETVASIVTDSKKVDEPKDPQTCNVFALHKFFSENELPELLKRYHEGSIGYHESKEILFKNISAFVKPLREKRKELEENRNFILGVLKKGGERARERAEKKMREVREKIGITLY